jgi:hypothetical protein
MKIVCTKTVKVTVTAKELRDIITAHVAKSMPEVKKMTLIDFEINGTDAGDECGSFFEFEGE